MTEMQPDFSEQNAQSRESGGALSLVLFMGVSGTPSSPHLLPVQLLSLGLLGAPPLPPLSFISSVSSPA